MWPKVGPREVNASIDIEIDPAVNTAVQKILDRFKTVQYPWSGIETDAALLTALTPEQRLDAQFQLIAQATKLLNTLNQDSVWYAVCEIAERCEFSSFKQDEQSLVHRPNRPDAPQLSDRQCALLHTLLDALQEMPSLGSDMLNKTYDLAQNLLECVPADQLAQTLIKMMNARWAENVSAIEKLLLDPRLRLWLDTLRQQGQFCQPNIQCAQHLEKQKTSLYKTVQNDVSSEVVKQQIFENVEKILRVFNGTVRSRL